MGCRGSASRHCLTRSTICSGAIGHNTTFTTHCAEEPPLFTHCWPTKVSRGPHTNGSPWSSYGPILVHEIGLGVRWVSKNKLLSQDVKDLVSSHLLSCKSSCLQLKDELSWRGGVGLWQGMLSKFGRCRLGITLRRIRKVKSIYLFLVVD
jgi:hypothetical protein